MGIALREWFEIMRGGVTSLAQHNLVDCLTRLGYDIEIQIVRHGQSSSS